MLTKFKNKIYQVISENICVNDQLCKFTNDIQNKLEHVIIKENQVFMLGNIEEIFKQLEKAVECIKKAKSENSTIDFECDIYYPQIIKLDKKWLHGKTRDEQSLPADIDFLGDQIDVEGIWSSLRDVETNAVITHGELADIKKSIKQVIPDDKEIFILVISTMVGAKPNTIISK
jgi:predicted nuclease with TOPRIM domain